MGTENLEGLETKKFETLDRTKSGERSVGQKVIEFPRSYFALLTVSNTLEVFFSDEIFRCRVDQWLGDKRPYVGIRNWNTLAGKQRLDIV